MTSISDQSKTSLRPKIRRWCVGWDRTSSEKKDEFENFIKNLELNFEHIANKRPFLIVVLGDFKSALVPE